MYRHTYLEIKRLFALSARIILRFNTAERIMTPKVRKPSDEWVFPDKHTDLWREDTTAHALRARSVVSSRVPIGRESSLQMESCAHPCYTHRVMQMVACQY